MRNLFLQTVVLSFFLVTSCTSNKDLAQKNTFTFFVDGIQYQIVSINTKAGEGTNFLTQLNSSSKQTKIARDLDQDGTLDQLIEGEGFSLADADIIYNDGINKAKELGNYTERIPSRTFEFKEGFNLYTIKTYFISEENANNLFLIYNLETLDESIFSDLNANGNLEAIEKGRITLHEALPLYTRILNEGIRQGKIEFNKEVYTVKELQSLQTARASYPK